MRKTLALIGMMLACEGGESVFGVRALGEPARVEWHRTEAAGGTVYDATIIVDSATGRYELHRCQGGVSGPCITTEQRSGDVPPAVLLQLFEVGQSAEFRELKAEYRLKSEFVPPDGGWTSLTIVVGERRKTVGWSKHVTPPEILSEYGCLLLAATESLLCD